MWYPISYPSDRYQGFVDSGIKEGHGTFTWADGREYCGGWHNDHHSGRGRFRWANGDVYDGEWEDGQQHGKGKFTWSDGEMFQGEWVHGQEVPHSVGVTPKHQQPHTFLANLSSSSHVDPDPGTVDSDDDVRDQSSSHRSSQNSNFKGDGRNTFQVDGDWGAITTTTSTKWLPTSRALRPGAASPRIVDLSSSKIKRSSK